MNDNDDDLIEIFLNFIQWISRPFIDVLNFVEEIFSGIANVGFAMFLTIAIVILGLLYLLITTIFLMSD